MACVDIAGIYQCGCNSDNDCTDCKSPPHYTCTNSICVK